MVAHRSRERSPVRRGLGKPPVIHRTSIEQPYAKRLAPWDVWTACGLVLDVAQASAVESDVSCRACKKVARGE